MQFFDEIAEWRAFQNGEQVEVVEVVDVTVGISRSRFIVRDVWL